MAVVHHDQGAVLLGDVADLGQLGDVAVHAEDAVRDDELEAGPGPLRRLELGLEIGHVAVLVAEALRLGEPDAVDEGGVVQLVGDDGVVLAHQGLEDGAVGVEAAGVELGVLHAEEFGQPGFQLGVDVLLPADEPHGGHAEAVGVHDVLGGLAQGRMVGQAQVVVRAEADHLLAVRDHLRLLGRGDGALDLEQALLAELLGLGGQVVLELLIHGVPRR